MQWWWCLALLFIGFPMSVSQSNSEQSFPLLLLVSFDGFRHDYPILHGPLKNFRRLAENGVRAHQMIPSFITATFPNHYTLVTGLYEEVHGLISNSMFDPQTNQTFESSGNLTTEFWWPHPAIWSINERRYGARSAVTGWPQARMWISKYEQFHRSRTFRQLTDEMIEWFIDPIEPINFGAIYFYEPDLTGHRTGPYSQNMTAMVRQCDENLGYLLDRIEENDQLRRRLHLIVTSDHGMAQINGTTNPIYLEDYLDVNQVNVFSISSVMNIFVHNQNQIETIWKNLSRIPHSTCYYRNDIPDRYHYKSHERIGDILLVMDSGYEIHQRSNRKKYDMTLIHGNHGYDNQDDSMKGIFYASGPEFKRNFTLDRSVSLHNVDLFNLMCYILQIDHCPTSNGTISHIEPFVINARRMRRFLQWNRQPTVERVVYLFVLIGLGLIIVLAILWSFVSFRSASMNHQRNKRSQLL